MNQRMQLNFNIADALIFKICVLLSNKKPKTTDAYPILFFTFSRHTRLAVGLLDQNMSMIRFTNPFEYTLLI